MKILWITNTIFPEPSKVLGLSIPISGGWMYETAKKIAEVDKNILAIATVYKGKDFVQYKIEFSSKIMLSYIIISIITNLSIISVIFILFKFTKNYSLILLISTLFNTIQGCILWKTVKKIMNN